jgi:hypothetical protein
VTLRVSVLQRYSHLSADWLASELFRSFEWLQSNTWHFSNRKDDSVQTKSDYKKILLNYEIGLSFLNQQLTVEFPIHPIPQIYSVDNTDTLPITDNRDFHETLDLRNQENNY